MPLSITDITRENGAACNHFSVTMSIDGVSQTKKLSLVDIQAIGDQLARIGPYKNLMLIMLLRYRLDQGNQFNAALLPKLVIND